MEDIFVTQEHLIEGTRLDRVLMQCPVIHEAGVTRSHVAQMIKRGDVRVNGVAVSKAGHVIGIGDRISIETSLTNAEALVPYQVSLAIVFEDESLLVIDKPAGLTVHPGAGNRQETLLNALMYHRRGHGAGALESESATSDCAEPGPSEQPLGSLDRGGIVHRLDKDTSGLLVVAKTVGAHAHLAQQFAERSVSRRYQALVLSTPRARNPHFVSAEGVIDAPIGRHQTQRLKMAVLPGGRRAVTHYRIVERFGWGILLELRLETGRTHQIRVHCAYRGAPLIGDPVYGSDERLPRHLGMAAQRFGRQALQAATLGFTHPVTNERMEFSSPMPPDFLSLLEVFRR